MDVYPGRLGFRFMVYGLWSLVSGLWFMVSGFCSLVSDLWFLIYDLARNYKTETRNQFLMP
jgi:hypothetical protein